MRPAAPAAILRPRSEIGRALVHSTTDLLALSHHFAALKLLKKESIAGMQMVAAAIDVAPKDGLHPKADVCPTVLVPIPQKNMAGAPAPRSRGGAVIFTFEVRKGNTSYVVNFRGLPYPGLYLPYNADISIDDCSDMQRVVFISP